MNRYRRALGLFAVGATAVLLGFTVGAPTAKAAPATQLLVDCCNDGVTGVPVIATIRPVDDNGLDDGSFRGTVTFSTTFTDDFTVEPHDDDNPKAYTFAEGDLTDGGQSGKTFEITFNAPGSGEFFASAPGLETVLLPDGPHVEPRTFTITEVPETTTTTTIPGETTTTTTPVETTTTTTVPGATSTTTTTIPSVTTTTSFQPGTTVRPTTTIIRTGAPIGRTAAAGTGLFVLGALFFLAGAIEIERTGKHYLPKS